MEPTQIGEKRRVQLPVIGQAKAKAEPAFALDIDAELQKFEAEQRASLGLDGEKRHWVDANPRVFTADQRAHTTILLGGLTMAHDFLITGALSGIGYKVQTLDVPDTAAGARAILDEKAALIGACNEASPNLVRRGGGTVDLEVRTLEESAGGRPGMLVVHLIVDCRDAMGANLVNHVAEAVAERLAGLARGRFGLRILSNLADRRCVRVRCRVPVNSLDNGGYDGAAVRDGIVLASRFAELDPYRAATHNKGIMNGIDPVILATGNDWRGVEAGAHAFAARSGVYRPLAIWRAADDGALVGQMELPMAIGTVGGTLRVHPGARLGLRILGVQSAGELGMVVTAAGLASNLAALRALATEGIQRGHMSLHARSVAVAAGAEPHLVEAVAAELSRLGDIRKERAEQVLAALRATAG